jgi:hypothetical protein
MLGAAARQWLAIRALCTEWLLDWRRRTRAPSSACGTSRVMHLFAKMLGYAASWSSHVLVLIASTSSWSSSCKLYIQTSSSSSSHLWSPQPSFHCNGWIMRSSNGIVAASKAAALSLQSVCDHHAKPPAVRSSYKVIFAACSLQKTSA